MRDGSSEQKQSTGLGEMPMFRDKATNAVQDGRISMRWMAGISLVDGKVQAELKKKLWEAYYMS